MLGPETKPRHYVVGWIFVALALGGLVFLGSMAFAAQEGVSLGEGFKTKVVTAPKQGRIGGVLTAKVIRDGKVISERSYKNQIVNAGETALRDCFGGTGTTATNILGLI